MRVVAAGVNQIMNPQMGLMLITHYQRLLDYIRPHFVHVMLDGKIVHSGGPEEALKLEEKGYDWLVPSPADDLNDAIEPAEAGKNKRQQKPAAHEKESAP